MQPAYAPAATQGRSARERSMEGRSVERRILAIARLRNVQRGGARRFLANGVLAMVVRGGPGRSRDPSRGFLALFGNYFQAWAFDLASILA